MRCSCLVLRSHRVRIVVSYDVLCPLGEDRGRVLPLVLRLDVGLVIAEVHAHEVASALGHRVCLVVGVIVARSQQETCIQSMKKLISNGKKFTHRFDGEIVTIYINTSPCVFTGSYFLGKGSVSGNSREWEVF